MFEHENPFLLENGRVPMYAKHIKQSLALYMIVWCKDYSSLYE